MLDKSQGPGCALADLAYRPVALVLAASGALSAPSWFGSLEECRLFSPTHVKLRNWQKGTEQARLPRTLRPYSVGTACEEAAEGNGMKCAVELL